jgi:hypothetical protein
MEKLVAERTVFVMQTYRRDDKGTLRPADTVLCRDESDACRRAERALATGRVLGANIVRQVIDETAGDYGEPEFLARFGVVPDLED